MTINPVGTLLFIKTEEGASRTESGLFLSASMIQAQRIVYAAGPESPVEIGSRVLVNPKKCSKITVEGQEYLVTKAEDLLATLGE